MVYEIKLKTKAQNLRFWYETADRIHFIVTLLLVIVVFAAGLFTAVAGLTLLTGGIPDNSKGKQLYDILFSLYFTAVWLAIPVKIYGWITQDLYYEEEKKPYVYD